MENKPTLLIVDDIAANRALLARRLGRHGFATVEAESGGLALELITQRHFDLVLLDVMMPGLNGVEVLKRIREKHAATQLPVIMVTARADGSDVAESIEAGANDYVTKPVDFIATLARIKTQLERNRAKRELEQANDALQAMHGTLEQRIADRMAELVRMNEELKKEIADRERSQAEIQYLAHHDSLTGLANRVLVREQLEQALAEAAQGSLAVLFLDLDGFKTINDTLGHSTGDGLLKCVANRLTRSVRDGDKIARLGGDEFAIIQLDAEQPREAAILADRLIEVIGHPHQVEGNQLSIGASIGIAVASEANNNPEDLLRMADLAMYSAKAEGRGRYRFFEPHMEATASARRSMESSLRTADIEKAFEVYYQPLVDVTKKTVACLEALLRWRHPEKGFLAASQFIPLAEEIGLIVTLGEWVLRRACREAANWPEHVNVAVNLSPAQFKYGGIVQNVADALASSGLPAHRLELEITESVLLDRAETNLAILEGLRELGVAISLDDFGTGYSSLSYLRTFRFDKVKIDRAFIGDLIEGNDSLKIVRAVTHLGRSFGMATVAEGVETMEQLRCLEDEGCSQIQGYLISPPRPASAVPTIISKLAEPGNSASLNGTRGRESAPPPLALPMTA